MYRNDNNITAKAARTILTSRSKCSRLQGRVDEYLRV